jgi:hypothetical protein
MFEVITDEQIKKSFIIRKLNKLKDSPTHPVNKITESNLKGILYRIKNGRLRDENVDIENLVTDLYCEVIRLRAICQLVVVEENDRIARRWNERAY